jgi:hypothetical protein
MIKTRKTVFVLLTAFANFLFSCSPGNDNQSTTAVNSPIVAAIPAYDTLLAKGKVTDSVICRNNNSLSYALYLPSYYAPTKQFPCIYFFDAHARGAMPARAYSGLAEKYGFVLIGSNTSKNGTPWQVTNSAVKALMQDSRSRINIDPRRIYTAGFSGGSRVASSIAIMDGGIAGVIGCAAGFPSVDQALQNKFYYFGIAGDYDFNLTEMKRLDEALGQNGFSHQLLTTGKIHYWPSAPDFQTGLLWMQVNEMKEHQPKNDTLIKAFKSDFDTRIAAALSSADWIKAHELLDGIVRILNGLTDESSYKKQLSALDANPAFTNAISLQAQLQEVELNGQQELQKQFSAQNEKWWSGKIAELNQNIRSAKTQQESQMNRRLLSYLGLVGYMYTDHALKADDLTNADHFLKVFKMADPQNPDCSYLAAVFYMKKGNPQQAISSLNEATSLGYNEVPKLTAEPVFSSLQNDEAFKKVVSKVAENYRSK